MNSTPSFPEIEEHSFGYVQRRIYKQPDLYHEEVVELDSPFATIDANGTKVFTFLLIGDQNAGKSTFLHSFTFQEDTEFLEITSFLPILTSTFVNTRFYFGDKSSKSFKPIDELPFLDTDLARLTLLITRDDFMFFLNEFEIQTKEQIFQLEDDIRYIVIQFIEIGGDHLDSIMKEHLSLSLLQETSNMEIERNAIHNKQEDRTQNKEIRDILSRSLRLLLDSQKTIYFINANSLFIYQFTFSHTTNQYFLSLKLKKESLQLLLSRLRFLNSIFYHKLASVQSSSYQRILFYISRLLDIPSLALSEFISSVKLQHQNKQIEAQVDIESFAKIILEETGLSIQFPPFQFSSHDVATQSDRGIEIVNKLAVEEYVIEILKTAFSSIKEKEKWSALSVVDVCIAKHLQESSETTSPTLNAKEIIHTVARCFKKEMVHSVSSPEYLVVHHLFNYFKKQATIPVPSDKPINYAIFWITKSLFQEYLESLEEESQFIQMNVSEVPESTLLNLFEKVAQVLASFPLIIPSYYSHELDHSNIFISLLSYHKTLFWNPELASSAIRPYLGRPSEVLSSTQKQPKVEDSILFLSHTNKQNRGNAMTSSESGFQSIRFPHHKSLVEVIESIIVRNIPFMGEFWFQSQWKENQSSFSENIRTVLSNVLPQLLIAVQQLIQSINTRWENILHLGEKFKESKDIAISLEQEINTFFWLLEDLQLAFTLQLKISQSPALPMVTVSLKDGEFAILASLGFSESPILEKGSPVIFQINKL